MNTRCRSDRCNPARWVNSKKTIFLFGKQIYVNNEMDRWNSFDSAWIRWLILLISTAVGIFGTRLAAYAPCDIHAMMPVHCKNGMAAKKSTSAWIRPTDKRTKLKTKKKSIRRMEEHIIYKHNRHRRSRHRVLHSTCILYRLRVLFVCNIRYYIWDVLRNVHSYCWSTCSVCAFGRLSCKRSAIYFLLHFFHSNAKNENGHWKISLDVFFFLSILSFYLWNTIGEYINSSHSRLLSADCFFLFFKP